MSGHRVLSTEQQGSLSAFFPDTQDRRGEGMGAAEHSNKNLQVLSCLAPGNVAIDRMLLVLAAGWCAGIFLGSL